MMIGNFVYIIYMELLRFLGGIFRSGGGYEIYRLQIIPPFSLFFVVLQ